MSKPFDPNSPQTQDDDNQSDAPEKPSHLKLVVSNPNPTSTQKDSAPPKLPRSTGGFSSEVCKKDEAVYQMLIQNPSHHLECQLELEFISNPKDYGIGEICHFPNIDDEEFSKFVGWDETLYGNLMVQFQMGIMEKLLLFCGEYNASGLVIYVSDEQALQLEVYDNIIVHREKATFEDIGEKTSLIIPANPKTFDKWIDFMESNITRLQQGLWLDQRFNPVIRGYLKSQQKKVVN